MIKMNTLRLITILFCIGMVSAACTTSARNPEVMQTEQATEVAPQTSNSTLAPTQTPKPTILPAPTITAGTTLSQAPMTLENTTWVLESYMDVGGSMKSVLTNTRITATFSGDRVSGSAGCNNYFAGYEVEGNQLTISNAGSTLMACNTPPGVMVQEAAYLEALQRADTFQVVDGKLTIMDTQRKTILIFSGEQPIQLAGSSWQVAMLARGVDALVSPLSGTQITAVFSTDGSLSGSAGCNQYRSTYSLDGEKITVLPVITTRKSCPTPGIMQQEADYLALLEEAASYQIKDRELRLLTAQQQLLLTYTMISEISATPVTSPAISTQPASLSVESFKNMDFRSGFTASGRAPLVNGEYREAGASGSALETVVRLAEPIIFGELPDARLAAAMPLTTDTGGSGTFYELALVVDLNGAPLNIASTFLGDRIKINSIKFENGQVVLDLIKQGPDDPMCCPTLHVMQKFALEGSDLVLISSEEIK